MSVSLSAAIARLHHHLDHKHLLPSKRKLDDYAPSLISDMIASPIPISSPSDPTLHFFIRTTSKTLVIHAHPDDTVGSIIGHVESITGIAACELRLIFRGRQLADDSTLADCSVQKDSVLYLTGRLRSTKHPRAWQLVNDIIFAVSSLVREPSPPIKGVFNVDGLVKEFLVNSITVSSSASHESIDLVSDHLEVFVLAGAPLALVRLYLSREALYRDTAERAVRHFMISNAEYLPKDVQVKCMPILLEFCKLLAWTVGKKDQLYVSCRSALASLLESPDWRWVGPLRWPKNVIPQLLPFAREMAEIVMAGLSSDTVSVSARDLSEFSSFLLALRRAVQDWMSGACPVPKLLYNGSRHQNDNWICSIYAVYTELLQKVDDRLKKLDLDLLKQKGLVQSESRWAGWSHILVVLTELNWFSDIYEDADRSLHSVLLARQLSLNTLIRRAKRNDSLHWLLKHKDLLDFEARRNLVLMMFPEGKDDFHELHEMLIDRSQLLEESFEYITQADASALHGGLFMEFKNEEATGPGVLREWFCLVCRAIFSPQNVLFLPCANDQHRFFPNPASAVDPLHLKYFIFSGRVIALALMHKVQVGIAFDRIFFLQLAGKSITLEDVKDADPCLYTSCKKILEMDAELLDLDALGLTFVREIEELGTRKIIELCPGGKDIVVNSKNREEYINLLIQNCFVNSVSKQISHFAQGFSDILANSKLQKFFFQSLDPEDFDRMLGGSDGVINVREWKAHTEYNGYKMKDRQISWFWKIVERMPAEQQRVLLFFWTSVKYLPVDGFCGLASKLYIYRTSESHDHLPTSHTCFYRLCLPPYLSMSMMRSRLQMITQEHVSCTFGIW
ncbi:E3 ubiquitin-protein ligase UPL5 [Typha latifolia]|uniref:E3 ubiquitin-protein ligase UPL5 n=1 Tax=Typha latifolia TaxID=4733 RepID=UPI003C2D6A27